MRNFIARFAKNESGATAIEYGLIAALIAVVLISALTSLGTQSKAKFEQIASSIGSAS